MARTVAQKLTRSKWLVCVVLLAAIAALHIWSLMRFPAPFGDEAWLASRAGAFVLTGRAFGPLDRGIADRFEGYWTLNQWFMTFADSLSVRILGASGLLPVRAVSLVFGFVLLAAIYVIGDCLGGRRLGWSSVFLVALSWPFLYSSHLARYDVVAAAFGFLAIALYFSRRQDFWSGLLSGICVGLAFETHAYSLIYAPAILVLYFWDYGWSMVRQLRLWGFLVGGSIGLYFYASLHVLPYPQTYLTVNQLAFGSTRAPPLLTFAPRVILQSVGDMAWMLFAVYQPMLVVMGWAAIALLRRHSRADQTLLVLSAVLVLAHALVVRTKFLYYAILVTPALDILVASFLLEFVRRPWRSRLWDYVSRIVVWGMAIGAVALTWSVLRTDFGQAYQMVQDRINQVVQPGDSVMSSQVYWFGLQDHKYYSWELLPTYQLYAPGSKLEDAFQEFHPDIFIMDRYVESFIADPSQAGDIYAQHLRLPRDELEEILGRRAELISVFDGGYYGQIHVYRLDWRKPITH